MQLHKEGITELDNFLMKGKWGGSTWNTSVVGVFLTLKEDRF
ncbi:hypothetical protein Niako_6337 [Niastella koreensis GR20-10]|uniref:Uncharacterized protein n=1 Tax=Niastella koreensis (strain DSM 17620 / KACC 11465 / NBRC 106392 / GR20-10) TaxID=700598 RepID=G8TCM1_NIAKG|nr:hypothetical protein Niako_6337 [Niastella koreensis GR20-10]